MALLSVPATNSWFSLRASVTWKDANHLLVRHRDYDGFVDAILWDVVSGEQVDTLHLSNITWTTEYSHDGISMAISAYGNEVTFIDVETQEYFRSNPSPDSLGYSALAWSHDDQILAVGTYEFGWATPAQTLLIDPQTGETIQRMEGTQQTIEHLVWTEDDRYLLVVDARQQLFVYDVLTGETHGYSDAHTLVGHSLEWRSDGSQFVIGSSLEKITVWDESGTTQVGEFSGIGTPVTHMQWQPEGDLIALQARSTYGARPFGSTLNFAIRDIETGMDVTEAYGIEAGYTVDFFDWRADGNQFVRLSDETLTIQDVSTGEILIEAPELHAFSGVQELLWSPAGDYILALNDGYGLGGSYVFNIALGEYEFSDAYFLFGVAVWTSEDELVTLQWSMPGHGSEITAVRPSVERNSQMHEFLRSYEPDARFNLQGLTTNTEQGFLSPNGNYAAVDTSHNGMIWDATNGAPLTMLANVAQVVWSPDETLVLVQRTDGRLWLLNADGTIREQLPATTSLNDAVGDFYWSPDSRAVAHLHDGVVDLWQFDD